MKTYETEETKLSEFEFNRRLEQEAHRQEQREAVAAAEKAFNSDHFVKLSSGYYRKSAVVVIRFLETTIHVRFSNGDIVSINQEEMDALTS